MGRRVERADRKNQSIAFEGHYLCCKNVDDVARKRDKAGWIVAILVETRSR